MDAGEKILSGIIVAIGLVGVVGFLAILMAFPIMWTWNATMPFIFSLPAITWGKAWCLMFLSGMLLKSTNTNKCS